MTVAKCRRSSRRLLLIVAAFALVLAIIPAIAIGAPGDFEDVSDTSVFVADIEWLASTGVTRGCNPPANTRFCPQNAVTREQMAAFLHRLADDVVAAKDHDHDADYLAKTGTAADAEQLDGMDSTEFLTKGDDAQPTQVDYYGTCDLAVTAYAGQGATTEVT